MNLDDVRPSHEAVAEAVTWLTFGFAALGLVEFGAGLGREAAQHGLLDAAIGGVALLLLTAVAGGLILFALESLPDREAGEADRA